MTGNQPGSLASRIKRPLLTRTELSRSAAIIMGGTFDFDALPDAALMACLAARGRRPNVLVECTSDSSEAVLRHLMAMCGRPVRYYALPGRLELPATQEGTLMLRDVAALTLAQQVQLYDWLTCAGPTLQVISLTTLPLRDLVEDGAFLESLYYRLNVIRLEAGRTGGVAPRASRPQLSEPVA
jgi:hypothetical protein